MQTVVDFRSIDPLFRHAIFFSLVEGLKEGASFEFLNDHDPKPLYNQVLQLGIPDLEWKYAESGPQNWRIQVTKGIGKNATREVGCCGVCGGEGHHS